MKSDSKAPAKTDLTSQYVGIDFDVRSILRGV